MHGHYIYSFVYTYVSIMIIIIKLILLQQVSCKQNTWLCKSSSWEGNYSQFPNRKKYIYGLYAENIYWTLIVLYIRYEIGNYTFIYVVPNTPIIWQVKHSRTMSYLWPSIYVSHDIHVKIKYSWITFNFTKWAHGSLNPMV